MIQVSGRRSHNRHRIRPAQARVSTCQLGLSNRNFRIGLLGPLREPGPGFTDTFLHACYLSSGSPAMPPRKAAGIKASICSPVASLITAHASSWGSQQAASQRCCLTAHWHAASGKRRKRQGPGLGSPGLLDLRDLAPGGGPRWQGSPGALVLGAEPKDSEAEPRMTEGGAHESWWGRGGAEQAGVLAVPRLAVHGAW